MIWLVIFAIGAIVGFKLGPAYMEEATIKKHFRAIARDGAYASGNRKDIEAAFSNRSQIDRIEAISPADILVEKTGSGLVLSANYTQRIPLVYNISACLDFKPSSR
jgi:hypothetical protein